MAAFLVGATGAYLAIRQPPLLADVEDHALDVERFDTPERQWVHAIREGTPEAYQAVIEEFPKKSYWTAQAKKQLALLHITSENDEEALAVLEELASMGEADSDLRGRSSSPSSSLRFTLRLLSRLLSRSPVEAGPGWPSPPNHDPSSYLPCEAAVTAPLEHVHPCTSACRAHRDEP